MNLGVFLALTTVGSAMWNTALVGAGYVLGENWSVVEGYVGVLSKIVLVGALLAVIVWIVMRLRESRR